MEVLNPNDVKVYKLSCGKSLPEWIGERKRRMLQKKNVDIRRRIELIQDFDMPGVSTGVKVSKDGQYILATGIYKPRVRCYDVNELSMKFERCFNAEVVKFEVLSDDYSKMVFLHCDRGVEFHVQYGSYYRIRIPKFGRDLAYDKCSCDMYFVGASSEAYRFNLEEGRFLNSFQTEASSMNVCSVNPYHQLFVCGTEEGKVEAWDRRSRNRVGNLDCAVSCVSKDIKLSGFPSVSALNFKDALTMAVGTETGQVLLYDLRANRPFLIKDHMYDLPIRNIEFIESEKLVASMDNRCVKFWNQNTGKAYTAIEPEPVVGLNDLCIIPNSGLLFLANEDKKILTYFIPSLGPAPKWCSFLDSLTEELEESPQDTVYDDYKYVTQKELEELGLTHLVGTNLLRAYMHGYFMDIRLYNKAKAVVQPLAYRDFQKKKIKEKIDVERKKRIRIKELPVINRELARELTEEKYSGKASKTGIPSLLDDERFSELFTNPDFECNMDVDDENYSEIRHILQRKKKSKPKKSVVSYDKFELVDDEDNEMKHTSGSSNDDDGSESEVSDEDQLAETSRKVKAPKDQIAKTSRKVRVPKYQVGESSEEVKKAKLYELKESEKFTLWGKDDKDDDRKLPLGERLKTVSEVFSLRDSSSGNRTFTFTMQKSDSKKKAEAQLREHEKERKAYRRSTKHLRK